jgi:hypothetical protein
MSFFRNGGTSVKGVTISFQRCSGGRFKFNTYFGALLSAVAVAIKNKIIAAHNFMIGKRVRYVKLITTNLSNEIFVTFILVGVTYIPFLCFLNGERGVTLEREGS